MKTPKAISDGPTQAARYATLRLTGIVEALMHIAGIRCTSAPFDDEVVTKDAVIELIRSFKPWIDRPCYAIYMSVGKIGLVSARFSPGRITIPEADDITSFDRFLAQAEVQLHKWTALELFPQQLKDPSGGYPSASADTDIENPGASGPTEGFRLLCRVLSTRAETFGTVMAPPDVMSLFPPGMFTNARHIATGGTSMAYHMSNSNASANASASTSDDMVDEAVLKVPLRPLLNRNNAESYQKEDRLLQILQSAWMRSGSRDRKNMPFPTVLEVGTDTTRPYLLLHPYGTSLSSAGPGLIVSFINDVLGALKTAHTEVVPPIYHNDVRGPNIIVVERKRAMLIDWGHAEQSATQSITMDEFVELVRETDRSGPGLVVSPSRKRNNQGMM